jgi:hypothetical protein
VEPGGAPHRFGRSRQLEKKQMFRGLGLWLLGIPIPIIILILFFL